METKLVIFDYDGVLVNSGLVVKEIYKRMAAELSMPELNAVSDNSLDMIDVDWKKTLNDLGITSIDTIEQVKNQYQKSFVPLAHLIKLQEGIQNVLSGLHGKYKLAVVSNNIKAKIEKTLNQEGVLQFFDVIIGDDYPAMKPDPMQLNICMEKLGVSPEQTVYVGDMQGDILAARNANLKKAIAVTFGFHSKGHLSKVNPDIIVDKPEEILMVIE